MTTPAASRIGLGRNLFGACDDRRDAGDHERIDRRIVEEHRDRSLVVGGRSRSVPPSLRMTSTASAAGGSALGANSELLTLAQLERDRPALLVERRDGAGLRISALSGAGLLSELAVAPASVSGERQAGVLAEDALRAAGSSPSAVAVS